MLKLIIGSDWTKNSDEIFRRLGLDVQNEKEGIVVLVPELISHDAERRLAQTAGDRASRFAEVLSFKRLARAVAEYDRCGLPQCLDQGGRVVAMAAVARMLSSRLKAYACLTTRPEFILGILEAIDEFKRCCISAEDIRIASQKTEGEFAQKLEELSLLYEGYDAITARGKCDPRDQMQWLYEQLESCDYAQTHTFYVDGFPDLTRQHEQILRLLIEFSPCVTVSIHCDRMATDRMAFEKTGATLHSLIRAATDCGASYEIFTTEPACGSRGVVLNRIFQGSTNIQTQVSDYLQTLRADSVRDECAYAAQRVLELVRGGARYRDIGVVCADLNSYETGLRMCFNQSGIPFYKSGKDDLLQKSVIDGLLSAMETALGGFEKQAVLRYMRSLLCSLEPEVCDMLENYAFVWKINGSGWTRSWQNHPDGLGGVFDEVSKKHLALLEDARFVLIEPLQKLSVGFRKATSLSQQVQVLYRYLQDISLADRLGAMADYMDDQGDNRTAQILDQLWDILLAAMEQIHDVLGETAWEPDSFVRLFTILLSQYDVGTIPTVLDSVCVGSFSAMRCQRMGHMILLGAKEGAFPSYSGGYGALSDREREQLRALDVPLTGGGMEGIQTEFYEIYSCFCAAESSVCVICGPDQPSFIYARLAALAGGEQKAQLSKTKIITDPVAAAAWLVSNEQGTAAGTLGLSEEYAQLDSMRSFSMGKLSAEAVSLLYGDRLHLSASQVDRIADCRFRYYLDYGVRLKELREAAINPAEFGTYVHYVMEKTAKEIKNLGGFHQVSLEDTLALAKKHSAAYVADRFASLDADRINYLFSRNMDELMLLVQELWQELHLSLFAPDQFEIGFGENKRLPAVEIPGQGLLAYLGGFVDRVDVWREGTDTYFRVVDYKTGQKSFDYCDVLNGMGLQMLLYMFSLQHGGEQVLGKGAKPAGVQYFLASFGYLPASSSLPAEDILAKREPTLKRKGLVLNDQKVLAAMEPEGAPKRLSVSASKSGELRGDLATASQLQKLEKYVNRVLRKLVNEIGEGVIKPNPYTRGDAHDACRYCPYGAVCHQQSITDRRSFKTVSAAAFWEKIEEEVGEHGR